MQYLFDRLKEKSTWTGILGLVSALGIYSFSDPLMDSIALAGVALAGVLSILFAEKSPE